MPTPAVYILAVVGTIAAGVAFKEFVYEPHIAPRIEQWAEEFLANRQARRRQRPGAIAVPVPGPNRTDEERRSIELENIMAKEVQEWRSEVDRSSLRHRRNVLDESTHEIPFVPMSPTHIIYDTSESSTLPSRAPSVSARLEIAPSELDPILVVPAPVPPVPSLSQSYPQELDYEHGLELLSPPSSRPDTPFSSFSQPLSPLSLLQRAPSRSLSDLDYLSDQDEQHHDGMSPRSSIDAMRSNMSDSSWASASAGTHGMH